MDVNLKSLESLQAYAYRILVQLEAGQKELQAVNKLIIDFKPEEPVEAEKVEEKSMPKGIKKVKEVIEEVVEEVKEVKTSFDVYNEKGDFVRNYSVELHGNEADKLAEGFALKINGTIK